jgi:amino acid transporter
MNEPPVPSSPESPLQRRGSFLQTMGAVAWSFFGVRRSADYAQDVQKLNPVHVVIAGIVGALLFIAVLVLLVRWVVGSGVAA